MTHLVLGKPDRDVLFTLIHFKEPATNSDLDAIAPKVEVEKAQRERLSEFGLISFTKVTRPRIQYRYELTDAGWAWVEEELAAAPPANADRTSRVDYPLHNRLAAFLQRNGLTLSALFVDGPSDLGDSEEAPAEDLAEAIASAYRANAVNKGDWVPLALLRIALKEHPRQALDEALESLFREGRIRLIAEVNRKALTAEDRDAAVHAGGEDKHLIRVASI
jgi:hypothetical protein